MIEEYEGFFGETEMDTDPSDRINELVELVRYHRDKYYNDTPEISDAEFDAYVDELRDLDPSHKILSEVGSSPKSDAWETGIHEIPMTSLDKVNTEQELFDWVKKRHTDWLCVQEKMDGSSLSAQYVDGVLKKVLTRGGGIDGEDITRNAVKMRGVQRVLPTRFTGSLRGEAMFVIPEFKAYNKKAASSGWTVFKNMRNGASGLARRYSGEGAEFLRVFFYDAKSDILKFDTHYDMMIYLRKVLGLWTPWFARVDIRGLSTVYNEYNKNRTSMIYEIDGLVIKVDSMRECREIEDTLQGSSSATANPKSQVAWKFDAETRVTKVIDVSADFGIGGRITPVAEVAPVKIGGVTITRATLHNWDTVLNLKIHRGCKVLIQRANEVIPKILEVLDAGDCDIVTPTVCPKCGSALITEGKFLMCKNTSCPGVIAGNIRKWINNLEIEYFGMSVIDALVKVGKLKNVADLYRLTEKDIAVECGTGIAKRAYENLHAKKIVPLYLVVGSLNITGFGRSLAKLLIKAGYDTIDKLLSVSILDIARIEKFGVERATQVWNGFRECEDLIRDLEKLIIIQSPTKIAGTLSGKSFCITGSLSEPKKIYQQMIEGAGGEYWTSVKAGLDYLIAADPDGASSKLQKARKMGINVIGEDELRNMISDVIDDVGN